MSFKNGQYIMRKKKEEGGAPAKKTSTCLRARDGFARHIRTKASTRRTKVRFDCGGMMTAVAVLSQRHPTGLWRRTKLFLRKSPPKKSGTGKGPQVRWVLPFLGPALPPPPPPPPSRPRPPSRLASLTTPALFPRKASRRPIVSLLPPL